VVSRTRNSVREFGGRRAKDFAKLLALLPEECRLFLRLFCSTGARPGEIESILWDWVDLDAGVINLVGFFTKNGHPRVLPLTPDLVADLRKMFRHNGKVFDTNVLRKRWLKVTKSLGLYSTQVQNGEVVRRPFRVYDLRHTAIKEFRTANVDRGTIKEISGHRTDAVFERYGTQDVQALHDAASARQKIHSGSVHTLGQVVALPDGRKVVND
jgi:integrase